MTVVRRIRSARGTPSVATSGSSSCGMRSWAWFSFKMLEDELTSTQSDRWACVDNGLLRLTRAPSRSDCASLSNHVLGERRRA